MVAIVTGKGAGIGNSSLNLLGAGGQLGNAGLGRAGESAYVDAATGNLLLTTVDEMLVGRGPDVVGSRTYNSQGAWDGDNNDQWRIGFYQRVTGLTGSYGAAASTVKRTDWDGSEVTYTWNASYSDGTVTGAYVATDGSGSYDILTRTSTTWTWVDGDTRASEAYDDSNSGRITGRTDASGNAISFTYASGLLTRVTAGSEYTDLVYSGSNLSYLETHTTLPTATTTRVYYEYDGSNRLTTVKVNLNPSDNSKTTGSNYTTTYTYDGATNRVASIAQSDGTAISFTYTLVASVYRVATVVQTIAGSTTRTTTFSYDTANRITTVTDDLGQATRFAYDANGNLLTLTMPPSGTQDPAPVISYTYEADGDVATMTAAGNTVTYGYDGHGNRTLERDSLGNTITRTFGTRNQLTETRWTTPDPDGAGANPATGPMTTRYAYDSANRLRFAVGGDPSNRLPG